MSSREPIVILGMRFRSRNRVLAVGFIGLAFIASAGIIISRIRTKATTAPSLTSVNEITGSEFTSDFDAIQKQLGKVGDTPFPTGTAFPSASTAPKATKDVFQYNPRTPVTPTPSLLPTRATMLPSPIPTPTAVGRSPLDRLRSFDATNDLESLKRVAVDTIEPTHIRVLAIYFLARHKTADGFEVLRRIVANDVERFPFRETALYAMVEHYPSRCAEFLITKVQEPKVFKDNDESMHDLVLLGFYADREMSTPKCRLFMKVMNKLEKLMASGNYLARQIYSFGMVHEKIPMKQSKLLWEIDDLVIRSNYVSWLKRQAMSTKGAKGLLELRQFANKGNRKEVRTLASVALAQVNETLCVP